MTKSDVINAFCLVRLWRMRIESKAREIARLEAQLDRCTAQSDRVPVQGGSGADLADCLDQLADLRREMRRMAAIEAQWSALTGRLLDHLDDPFLAEIMMMRYLDRRTWAQIAQDLHCNESTVYRARNRAIEALAQISP